ncbi:MAG: TIR domain-containing protein [bacterium]|nr:TIR domain-containing protein [bacterium]
MFSLLKPRMDADQRRSCLVAFVHFRVLAFHRFRWYHVSMDRDEAIKLLTGRTDGIAEWNRRWVAGETIPNLHGVNLRGATLHDADLRGANLSDADLSDATLSGADLIGANLSGADLIGANLSGADLSDANLSGASLSGAHLSGADLSDANLSGADLSDANLSGADLSNANLSDARLSDAELSGAKLSHANLASAMLAHTTFASVNLSEAKNLDRAHVLLPCSIGVDTLVASQGRISDSFLRGCGLQPWQVLEAKLYDPDLTPAQICDLQTRIFMARTTGPLLIGGVFISYSHADVAFVDKLYKSLQAKGVPVWLDRHDLVSGRLDRQIVDAIRLNDIVLLVLSDSSVNSDWVDYELKAALKKEHAEHRDVLCPVALDAAWQHKTKDVLWHKVRERNVLDFSKWRTDAYAKQFDKLLKGLAIYYTPPAE